MNSIEIRKAFVGYRSNSSDSDFVLNGLNMTVKTGSIYALIGASGCGKTTLLSCILGIKALDSGSIRVLGHSVSPKNSSAVARLIGYMPQDIALSSHLTIAETLSYFGNIFCMNKQKLGERTQMLLELLELPEDDREIGCLSGGQKRRVSLAAAIIHNPLVLILDEPTVGLDSILREKIWKFLIKSTCENNVSIIITTHYISEAQRSDRCGMMRDGVLLAEDSPCSILLRFDAENLDEAFLNVCKSAKPVLSAVCDEGACSITDVIDAGQAMRDELTSFKRGRKHFAQTITTLFQREWVCVKRGKFVFISNLFYLPLLSIVLIFGPGGNPNGLRLGVVNYEVIDPSLCDIYLKLNGSYRDELDQCVYRHLSCHFLNQIRDDDGIKVSYSSIDTAREDAKRGKVTAIITIQENFSEALQYLHESANASAIEFSEIDVNLDQTNMQVASFIRNRLMRSYTRFAENLIQGCNRSKEIAKSPLNVSPMFGSLYENFKRSMLPVFLIQSAFMQTIAMTCYKIAQSKIEGTWNRTVLAGVRPIEILLVQVMFSMFTMTVSLFNGLLVLFLALGITDFSVFLISFTISLLLCTAGLFLSVLISALTKDVSFISVILFGGSIIGLTTSGLFWPVEGQPALLQQLSYALPFAFTSSLLRSVIGKGLNLTESGVYIGFLVIFAWIIGAFLLALVAVKKRKFS